MKLFPPKHRLKIYGAALLALGVLGCVLWSIHEPSYNGRNLSEWLEQIRDFSDEDGAATHAVRQIGPQAVPTLVRMLQQTQPKWKAKVNEWIAKWNWPDEFAFHDYAAYAQKDALNGFRILGPAARSAIPSLAPMLNDAEQGPLAVEALRAIGLETAPLLLKVLGSTNQQTRADAAFALTSFQTNVPGLSEQMWTLRRDTNEYVAMAATHWTFRHGPSTQRVEVLVDALRDGRRATLGAVLSSLRHLGTDWTNVLPEMVQLMNSPNRETRDRITNAIRRLDPMIAASVGIHTNPFAFSTNGPASPGRRGGRRGR